jgi:hypothetical protein
MPDPPRYFFILFFDFSSQILDLIPVEIVLIPVEFDLIPVLGHFDSSWI